MSAILCKSVFGILQKAQNKRLLVLCVCRSRCGSLGIGDSLGFPTDQKKRSQQGAVVDTRSVAGLSEDTLHD